MLILAELTGPILPSWTADGRMLRAFAPELSLVAAIIATLIVPFFTRKANKAAGAVALAGIGLALITLLASRAWGDGTQFSGMLVADPLGAYWKAILLVFAGGVALMWFASTGPMMRAGDGPEFFTLLLVSTTGMCLMGCTSNLLMMFLSMEMASLPAYVLAGFRKTDSKGSEAALKYVVFGAACSAVMVYGMTWLYGLYGTLQVEEIAKQINVVEGGLPLMLGIAGLIVGMGYKISIVPLHFWCPDVFEGSGTDVAAFLSVASKGASLMMLMRTVLLLAGGAGYQSSTVLTSISIVMGVLGAITATVGNLGAFTQENIKRLLAYSSISHAGYMLCLLAIVTAKSAGAGAAQSADVAQAMLIYLTVYLFMNLGAFTVAASVERAGGGLNLSGYAQLGKRSPILAICMTLCLFSLVGMPPLAGFTAKLNLMLALANAGGWLWSLVAVIGVNTVFSLYYYARVIRQMYLVDSDKPALSASKLGMAISMACCAMLVLMLIGFGQAKSLSGQFGKIQGVNQVK